MRPPVNFRWFAEGRMKDINEPQPLPSQWAGDFGSVCRRQWQADHPGIFAGDPDNPERPVVNRYRPSWEGGGPTLFGRSRCR
jgi:trimethylamine-N-oxide reductase (cytochrome c)